MLKYMKTHDWMLDYMKNSEKNKDFCVWPENKGFNIMNLDAQMKSFDFIGKCGQVFEILTGTK